MAEGTSLLRMHTAYTCIVSSNLTVSAMLLGNFIKSSQRTRLFPAKWRVFCYVLGRGTALSTNPSLAFELSHGERLHFVDPSLTEGSAFCTCATVRPKPEFLWV